MKSNFPDVAKTVSARPLRPRKLPSAPRLLFETQDSRSEAKVMPFRRSSLRGTCDYFSPRLLIGMNMLLTYKQTHTLFLCAAWEDMLDKKDDNDLYAIRRGNGVNGVELNPVLILLILLLF
jgi:hypothetical protein